MERHPRNWEDEADEWIFVESGQYFAGKALWNNMGDGPSGQMDRKNWITWARNTLCPIRLATFQKQVNLYTMLNYIRVLCHSGNGLDVVFITS